MNVAVLVWLVSTTVLCTCVRQARRSAETSAAGVRTDDISVTRRLRIHVLQALLGALLQHLAVQAVVSDFEAALWSAVKAVFPGVAQRGCTFHFSQAVWRNVQSVGLQSAYAKDDVINRPRLQQDAVQRHVSNAAQVLRAAAQPHLPAVGRVQRRQSLRLQSVERMLADVPPLMISDCLYFTINSH